MKIINFDVTVWTVRKTGLFLLLFVMIYGISAHGLSAFWQLYQNPFELLPLGKQWMHESPIQFIIGHYLFSSLNWWMAFTFVQFLAFFTSPIRIAMIISFVLSLFATVILRIAHNKRQKDVSTF